MSDWFDVLEKLVGPYWAPILFVLGVGLTAHGLYYYKFKLPAGATFQKDMIEAQTQRSEYVKWRWQFQQKGWLPGQIYSYGLGRFLDLLDRFFGTSDKHESKFPRYWGPKSLDRCFSIALVYPIVTLVTVWAVTGNAGVVEETLDLFDDLGAWSRLKTILFLAYVSASMMWIYVNLDSPRSLASKSLSVGNFLLALTLSYFFFGSASIVAAVAVGIAAYSADAFFATFGLAFAAAVAVGVRDVFFITFVIITALYIVLSVIEAHVEQKFGHTPVLGLILFALVYLLGTLVLVWQIPLKLHQDAPNWITLVFFGVLPLINAVFDWVSIGLTRFLLRRGQNHPLSPMPIVYAIVDLVFATVMLFALMVVCLSYLSLLNHFAILGSGQPALDLAPIMTELRSDAPGPSVWWIYVTVFTTFLPSFINLILGCLSFVRGIPGLWNWVLVRHLPADPSGLTRLNRMWVSTTMTVQLAIALLAASIMAWLVLYGVLSFLSLIGANMLDVAEIVIAALG